MTKHNHEHKSTDPADWKIIATSPGGRDLSFSNTVTGEESWYPPKGMSAEQFYAIPDAKQFFASIKDVVAYLEQMQKEEEQEAGTGE